MSIYFYNATIIDVVTFAWENCDHISVSDNKLIKCEIKVKCFVKSRGLISCDTYPIFVSNQPARL